MRVLWPLVTLSTGGSLFFLLAATQMTSDSGAAVSFSPAGIAIVGALLMGVVGGLSYVFRLLQAAKDAQIRDLQLRAETQSQRLSEATRALTDALSTTVAQNRELMQRLKDALEGISVLLERQTRVNEERIRQASEEHLTILDAIQQLGRRTTDIPR